MSMQYNEVNPSQQNGNIFHERERELSSSLFASIKPICIEINKIASLPPSVFKLQAEYLVKPLDQLVSELHKHREVALKSITLDEYFISANLADYIFFPVSNLLKQNDLHTSVIIDVLDILSFLLDCCWRVQRNSKLSEQLYPVILFLCDSHALTGDTLSIASESINFKSAVSRSLKSLILSLPFGFLTETPKGYILFGSTFALILELISSITKTTGDEDITLLGNAFESLQSLINMSSPQNMSRILPGVTSSLIKFFINSSSLHYQVVCNVIDTLKSALIKVFEDHTMEFDVQNITEAPSSLTDLNDLMTISDKKTEITTELDEKVIVNGNQEFTRSPSWLKATRKQLKVSLTIFFKTLFTSQKFSSKIKYKRQVQDSVLDMANKTIAKCFFTLFEDIVPLLLDSCALLLSFISYDEVSVSSMSAEDNIIEEVAQKIIGCLPSRAFKKESAFNLQNLLTYKLNDILHNKLPSSILSIEDEKMNTIVVSIKFHFVLIKLVSAGQDSSSDVTLNSAQKLAQVLVECIKDAIFHNQKTKKKSTFKDHVFPKSNSASLVDDEQSRNVYDNIKLPGYINASRIGNTSSRKRLEQGHSNMNNALLVKSTFSLHDLDTVQTSELAFFDKSFTKFFERKLQSLLFFVSQLISNKEEVVEFLINHSMDIHNEDKESKILKSGLSLWISSLFMTRDVSVIESSQKFNIDDFLDLDSVPQNEGFLEVDPRDDQSIVHLILDFSQDLLDEIGGFGGSSIMTSRDDLRTANINEISYAIALHSIGLSSRFFSLSEFESSVMIDYLYPLIEGLTLTSQPLAQLSAAVSLKEIADLHYGGSLQKLIASNSDYLIDSLSIRLSTACYLHPNIPSILYVILKISGIQLLKSNHLHGILQQLFVMLDSYHGYVSLVEGCFLVLTEVVKCIKAEYLHQTSSTKLLIGDGGKKAQKGLGKEASSIQDVLDILDASEKIKDPFNQLDSGEKMAFKKRENRPFVEQVEDSDDEDVETDENPEEPQEKESNNWTCHIPYDIYMISQRIFNYAFQLISLPSNKLRILIMKNVTETYPILVQNYALCMPCISQNWHHISYIISEFTKEKDVGNSNNASTESFVSETFKFLTDVINADAESGELFLSRKFIELWEQIQKLGLVTANHSSNVGTLEKASAMTRSVLPYNLKNVTLRNSINAFLICGLDAYGLSIPDRVVYDIVKFCRQLGVEKETKQSRRISNILVSIKNMYIEF
ncbi:Piso0_005300 [Millerozyma farinosa CBS 7064]|uniref:Piso0_005300 protein n=1 Tax=Pichia sorbitophila (strain ATCC MYA-4447 / BCRC 22081 / CBS 7064 / NBRC 10061 / NRRL Y-12695) TaxID=559304 RepID=G8Y4R1_PICSO|nr:Piso0_005300 [Millerozyma farinosa CBS 7064]